MRILVITSCTGEKAVSHENQLTLEDFQRGKKHVRTREKEFTQLRLKRKASQIYTGQQHIRLMRGIEKLASASTEHGPVAEIDLRILSAGYGIIKGTKSIAPYECTFQGMKSAEIRDWADTLNVPGDFRSAVGEEYDLGLVLLSDDYLKACRLDSEVEFGGPTLLFCGASTAKRLPTCQDLRPIVASTPETKRFNAGLVALKGELGGRALEYLATAEEKGLAALCGAKTDVLSLLEECKPKQDKARSVASRPQPSRERTSFAKHTPRTSASIHYFIPEWDDRVDPDYDFLVDGITLDRDPYNHDVYAHEIYQKPNYDGILVSKSVIEDNQKKKARIESVGIHAHVRVPRSFPVMGDCGAFNYINDHEPPYETEETVGFYQSLDFDFGVSIDHLIVPQHMQAERRAVVDDNGATRELSPSEFAELKSAGLKINKTRPSKRLFNDEPELFVWLEDDLTEVKRRWNLTLKNAEEFIREHKRQKATFTPIAGCQGWDVESQTEMFAQQQDMGYDYIALGGLVRSQTKDILEILDSVNKIRKPTTRIHLFGVARPEAIPEFVKQGVNSIDSARFLRQAWLSATSNYYSGNPTALLEDDSKKSDRYTAIRIPPIYRENSTTVLGKAKKLVSEGFSVDELEKLEQKALSFVHAFDRDEADLEETLEAIVEYDQLMGGDPRNEPLYRKLLEDKPWKECPCSVCQTTGIDVVVFRRNNRNRRRGFHNTWWFFEFFKQATNGSKVEA